MASRGATVPILALLLLASMSGIAHGQVFIASRPHPEFRIGPLFVSASVTEEDVVRERGPLTVAVSWSLALPSVANAAGIAQDLYLLWPEEAAGTPGTGGADPVLKREVEALGFKVKEHGSLRLMVRSRTEMGTGAALRPLGAAPFVTLGREGALAARARGATYIRIPWVPELSSPDWLVRLELPLREVIVPRRVSWVEDVFWGKRYIIALGFGDVGYVSLYPLYFGARDRVVPLARDFSMVSINFGDSNHLKVDDVLPSSASRRPSETRNNTEAFQLPLLASEGLAPQVLKVQFTYFAGRLPWRPIIISTLFLGLGNLMGPLVGALARRLVRMIRARIHVGRGEATGEARGAIPAKETLAQIHPGETSYERVLTLCGPPAEEHVRGPAGESRTLLYRGQRVAPHRHLSFGWFATVSHWDVEDHEIQLDFEHDRVRDIQVRVRRSRPTEHPLG